MPEKVNARALRGNQERVALDRLPDECPVCHHRVNPEIRHVTKIDMKNRMAEVVVCYQCPNQGCQTLFVGYYAEETGASNSYRFRRAAPRRAKEIEFPDEISDLSSSFVDIFNQSLAAESAGLDQVVGIGLRKALEFLIKDYLVNQHPEEEENIRSLFLSACIQQYVDDHNIKECATRAIWIGNDEAHYTRRWQDKDIDDLKTLIRLTVNWIESNLLTQRYISEMAS